MKKTIFPFTFINFILIRCLFFVLCIFLASCERGKEKTTARNEDGDEQGTLTTTASLPELDLSTSSCNTSSDPKPILRLGKLIHTRGGTQITPIRQGSVGSGNVHVITHGWAPYYLTAVNDYRKNHPGGFLKAWDPQAKETKDGKPTGERFFVGKFVPLGQSILVADPGATVLYFSWIDHSATNSVDDPGRSEDCTTAMGVAMDQALDVAFTPRVSRKLHFLGHSHGAKVVTVGGILSKRKSLEQIIQLTLFDSPELAPLNGIDNADNKLGKILPYFSPNRKNRFVENYISYYSACFNQDKGLNQIVDITLRPRFHGCWEKGVEGCITCAHEYGITWYTSETKSLSGYGLGWSPLINPSIAPLLSQDYLQNNPSIGIAAAHGCKQKVIYSCEDLSSDSNTRKKTN